MNVFTGHNLRTRRGCSTTVLRFCLALTLFTLSAVPAIAQQASDADVQEPGIDPIGFRGPNPADRFGDIKIQQNLGMQVPLDLMFRDENDQPVRLGDLFTGKPVVLSLVYYGCPMLCTLVLNGMVTGFDGQPEDFRLGEEFTAISVSINPEERGALATEKKTNYLEMLQQDNAGENWHFLTGDAEAIETLAETVGFRYYYDESTKQYAHDSGIMIMTPAGKVSSYYLGIEYIPTNLRRALEIAGVETIGQYLKQPSLLCYYYDPTHGTYGLVIMNAIRIGGMLTVSAILAFWAVSYLISSRARKHELEKDAQTPSPAGLSGSV